MSVVIPDTLKQEIQSAYSRYLEQKGFKARYGQRLMIAEAVKGLLRKPKEGEQSPVAVIEAGTGTGKTVAYLSAAIPLAKMLDKHLVIATATVALQEQIVLKDLPDLAKNSGVDINFQLIKGRGRYLCLSKLDLLLQNHHQQNPNQALYEDELDLRLDDSALGFYETLAETYAKGDWDGERDNWPEEIADPIWQSVTTDHNQCSNRRCSHFSTCCFFKARQGLDQVDCVVANHDLVLSDLALGGGAILPAPEDTIYIFDEGHHLPDKALQHFSNHLRVKSTQQWVKQLPKTLSRLNKELGDADALVRHAKAVPELCESLGTHFDRLYDMLVDFKNATAESAEDDYLRFAQGVVPHNLRQQAELMRPLYQRLLAQLDSMAEILKDAMNDPTQGISRDGAERWYPTLGRLLARTEAALALWHNYSRPVAAQAAKSAPEARWLALIDSPEGGRDLALHCSPILADKTLDTYLWQRCAGAIVTSATLTALGQFERLKMRTGLADYQHYCRVPSPFDYSNLASICVPPNLALPSDVQQHDLDVAAYLKAELTPADAVLVLFTSWRQMRAVLEEVEGSDLFVLAQGNESKQEILRRHRERVDQGKGSVLFGLASFAEGVDLPGAYLKRVVITKIPFSVPNDPVESALHEWVKARGRDPFMDVSVPDASVRLIQACGRLVRSETDTGQVDILDVRLIKRRYGQALLDALPPFARR